MTRYTYIHHGQLLDCTGTDPVPDGALLIIGLALAALAIALLVVTLRGRRGAGSMTRRD